MKRIVLFSLAVSAVGLLSIVIAGTASATVLCKTATNPCSSGTYAKGTKVEASLKSTTWLLRAGYANVTCTEATIAGEVSNPGPTGTVSGTVSSIGFGNCGSFKLIVLKTGTFSISSAGAGNGTLVLEGFEITTSLGSTSCAYGGTASFSLTGGSMAFLKPTTELVKTAGGILCANPAKLEAEYTITSPEPLYVESEGTVNEDTVLCKTATNPCTGGTYAKGTKVEASLKSTTWLLRAGYANVTCTEGSFKGEVEYPGPTGPVTGPINSLSFGNCGSFTVNVLKTGTFSISSTGAGNGTLFLEGFEITTSLGSTSCSYGGTAPFSLTGGSMASLKSTAGLTKTVGGFLCASPAKLEAEYTVTSPEPLYVESS